MAKTFVGPQLRQLRRERKQTQAEMAKALGISPGYVNLLENNQRSLSVRLLMALADTAMVFACAAAWSGYRPMSAVDQTMHFLRPVNFTVLADARIVRIGRSNCFGRVMLSSAADKRPIGMVSRSVQSCTRISNTASWSRK